MQDEINSLLQLAIPNDPTRTTEISHIPRARVQEVIDVAWQKLDDTTATIHPELQITQQAALLRKLCMKLSTSHDVLPSTFYVSGVICSATEPHDSGAFADIYRAQYKDTVVILKKPKLTNDADRLTLMRDFCRESLLWSKLKHRHVLPFIGVSRECFATVCMVLPRMAHGNLRRRMSLTEPGLLLDATNYESRANQWLYETALGLAYLHDQGVVHGDLHPGNILVDAEDRAVLTDFGFALIAAASPGSYGSKHGLAAYQYMAPEFWKQDESDDAKPRPCREADVYAFACVCIEAYTRREPFAGPRRMTFLRLSRLVQEGNRPPRPSTPFGTLMSEQFWNVVQGAWRQEPKERLTAAVIASELGRLV